jgi:hypothetical protein
MNMRRISLISILHAIIFPILFCSGCGTGETAYLVREGSSPYVIVTAEGAIPSEHHAAEELRKHIMLATGADIPVVTEDDSRVLTHPRIMIGWSETSAGFGEDDCILRTVPSETGSEPDIVIHGGRPRGTLNGVYSFLDQLGFRWYTPRVTRFPESDTLPIPELNETFRLPFMYRHLYFLEAFDPDWAARNLMNGNTPPDDRERGGHVNVIGVHTFDRLIPLALFTEHPEYFPLIGDKRITGYVQRCLSNPEVADVAAENMIAWMNELPDEKIFSLSAADTEGLCECPDCVAMTEKEDSPAGLYLDFVNRVAEKVGRVHPDRLISTLAYTFTVKPPKTVRPRENVVIRLCPIENCVGHPFTACNESTSVAFNRYIDGWSKLTDRIFIWHYATDFEHTLMPFPNLRSLDADIKEYHARGVKGLFIQGAHVGGSDNDLRAWVVARLLQDPVRDMDTLVNEWLMGVYGPAWKPIRAYLDLIHERVDEPGEHLHIFDPPTSERWSTHMIAAMDSLHDTAIGLAAGDSTAVYYIEKSRLAIDFLAFSLGTGRLAVQDGVYRPVECTVTEADLDRLIADMETFGYDAQAVGMRSMDINLFDLLRMRVQEHAVETIGNCDIRLDIVPSLGGSIVSIIDMATGTNVLHGLDPRDNHYPAVGGSDEMTALGWGCTGFSQPYEAVRSGRSVRLTGTGLGGLVFNRTISVPEEGMRIDITSEIVNDADGARSCRLVSRMHLRANPQNTTLTVRRADGSFAPPELVVASDTIWPYRGMSRRYDGDVLPWGMWRATGLDAGFMAENRFDPDSIEGCTFSACHGMDFILMELHSPERVLPPGGRIGFGQSWEFAK